MFYSIDLLSHRRRGKLAACWLAAMTSEKLFKRYYNIFAIKKMDIIRTCEEILRVIQINDNKTLKFSLYLSSQLMCGVTKIYYYQIMYYQKDIFDTWQKLNIAMPSKKKGTDFDAVRTLDSCPIEVPPLTQDLFPSAHLNEDLHILPGEKPDGRLQMIMQDATCLNFGALTDEMLDYMLDHIGGTMFDANGEMQIAEDNNNEERGIVEMMAGIEIEEVHREMHSPRIIHSPMIVDVSKSKAKSRKELPVTPQKRQTRQPQVETPTKRRRLSQEDGFLVPLPMEPMEKVQAQQAELDMELESLHSSFFIIEKRPKRVKFIDKRIILENQLLKHWRSNIEIFCTETSEIPQVHWPTTELFKQPSHCPKRWCDKLYDQFVAHISGPFTVPTEDVAPVEMRVEEVVRLGETTSKLDLPAEEWSTLGKIQATVTADGTSALENMSNLPSVIERIDLMHEIREVPTEPLVNVDMVIPEQNFDITERAHDRRNNDTSNTDETLLDIESMLGRRSYSERRDRISKSCSSQKHTEIDRRDSKGRVFDHSSVTVRTGLARCYLKPAAGNESATLMCNKIISFTVDAIRTSESVYLTRQNILALLEVLWRNQEYVKFTDLISRGEYTKADAATVFYMLLELHAKKQLVLQQTACYRSLWMRKYDGVLYG